MPTTQGTWINRVAIYEYPATLGLEQTTAGDLLVRQGSVAIKSGYLLTAGLCLLYPVSTTDAAKLQTEQTLLFRFRCATADTGQNGVFPTAGVIVRPFLAKNVAGVWTKSDLPIASVAGQSVLSFAVDLTALDPAARAGTTHIGWQFVADTPLPGGVNIYETPTFTALPVLEIGPVTFPGNLLTGTTIEYRVVEWDATTDPAKLLNVIQSDGSAFSQSVTPTTSAATAKIALSPRKNSAAGYVALYRFGDFADGYGRLLALIAYDTTDTSPGADAPKGLPPYYAAPGNPYIAVSKPTLDTITITDNTPASWLLLADTYKPGREAPPAKIREIVSWQSRLLLLAGLGRRSELYASWQLSADANAGLYFSRSVSPTDPDEPVKGFYSHIGTEDGDRALRLLPLQDQVAILFETKPPYLLIGSDPSNFQLRPFSGDARTPLGLAARNAATLFGDAVYYLTVNGLVAWNPQYAPRNLSEIVRALVTPRLAKRLAFRLDATALISLWEHGGKLYLAVPTTQTDAAPNSILVYAPTRLEEGPVSGAFSRKVSTAWSRWTGIVPTGGVDMPGSDAQSGHYILTTGGQIVLCAPFAGDKATSGSAETPIPFVFRSRAYGYENGPGYGTKRPYRLDLDITNGDPDSPLALTLSLSSGRGQNITSFPDAVDTWTSVYTITPDTEDQPSLRPGRTKGELFDVGIAGSSAREFILNGVRVTASTGSERRNDP